MMCISYPMLCNKLPQTQQLKTTHPYFRVYMHQEPEHNLVESSSLKSPMGAMECGPGLVSHPKAWLWQDL